jgi:hypothetical protein
MRDGRADPKKLNITKTPMSDADCLNAFRVVRAFAELEDIVTLVLCKSVGGNEALTNILLGGAGFSAKLEKLLIIGDLYWPALAERVRSSFNVHFKKGELLRHALAHGAYMGVAEMGSTAS